MTDSSNFTINNCHFKNWLKEALATIRGQKTKKTRNPWPPVPDSTFHSFIKIKVSEGHATSPDTRHLHHKFQQSAQTTKGKASSMPAAVQRLNVSSASYKTDFPGLMVGYNKWWTQCFNPKKRAWRLMNGIWRSVSVWYTKYKYTKWCAFFCLVF